MTTHLYFHCRNADRIAIDPSGIEVDDLVEAQQYAVQVVRRMLDSNVPTDWRSWTLHVADEDGEELFLMPFACVIGKPQ